MALVRCIPDVEVLIEILQGDERMEQAQIDHGAIPNRLRQIAGNAGAEGAVVLRRVRDNRSNSFGYNAGTGVFEDMIAAGVIDSTKVVRTAIENAASIASLMLTTEAMISEVPGTRPMPVTPTEFAPQKRPRSTRYFYEQRGLVPPVSSGVESQTDGSKPPNASFPESSEQVDASPALEALDESFGVEVHFFEGESPEEIILSAGIYDSSPESGEADSSFINELPPPPPHDDDDDAPPPPPDEPADLPSRCQGRPVDQRENHPCSPSPSVIQTSPFTKVLFIPART